MTEPVVECDGHDFSGEGQEFFLNCGICKDLRTYLKSLEVVEVPSFPSKRPSKPRKTLSRGKGLSKKKKAVADKKSGSSKKPKSVSKLVKELDTVFSRFVRISRMDKDEMVECYTCKFRSHYKKVHAGHYISRWYKRTRWDENNVRPQCFMCNIYKKGDAATFRMRLVDEIGLEAVREMEKNTIDVWVMGKLKREWLEEKLAYYKAILEKELT